MAVSARRNGSVCMNFRPRKKFTYNPRVPQLLRDLWREKKKKHLDIYPKNIFVFFFTEFTVCENRRKFFLIFLLRLFHRPNILFPIKNYKTDIKSHKNEIESAAAPARNVTADLNFAEISFL